MYLQAEDKIVAPARILSPFRLASRLLSSDIYVCIPSKHHESMDLYTSGAVCDAYQVTVVSAVAGEELGDE